MKRSTETDAWPSLFSLNWVIRLSSPNVASAPRSHAPSECSGTLLWAKMVHRPGSRPAAISVAAVSSVFSRSVEASYGTLIECRSTTQ